VAQLQVNPYLTMKKPGRLPIKIPDSNLGRISNQ